MASIRKDLHLSVPPEVVWDAVRDVGAVHKRLCPGVLTDARLEKDARIVTFANGMTIRELIVDIDDEARRFVWAAVGDPLTHHHASMQVFDDGDRRSRLVWITDILPNSVAGNIQALIDKGAVAIRQTLEAQAADQDELADTHSSGHGVISIERRPYNGPLLGSRDPHDNREQGKHG